MTSLMITGIILLLAQVLGAIPWVLALLGESKRAEIRSRLPLYLGGTILVVLVGGCALGFAFSVIHTPSSLRTFGHLYGALFQIQLIVDFFLLVFFLMHQLWPKGAAVARAAFREGYRQPMFWLISSFGLGLLLVAPLIPYFTFGEDYMVVQELGYDAIILSATLFGVLAASMSISEEIEGRTAVTVMSKPISRRQFLLGKFAGLFLVSLMIIVVLGWWFQGVLIFKRWFDEMDPLILPKAMTDWVESTFSTLEERSVFSGLQYWFYHVSEVVPGLVKCGSMVMILIAIAVMLATRFHMIVNLVTCLVIYFLANLMPILVDLTQPGNPTTAGTVQQLLHFVAQLFNALLPGLEVLRVNPTLVGVNAVDMGSYVLHVLAAGFYGILYTSIVLILGLVLFEDRDLA